MSEVNNLAAFLICVFFSCSVSIGVFLMVLFLYMLPKIQGMFDNVTKNMNTNFQQFNALNQTQATQINQDSNNFSRMNTFSRSPAFL